MPTVEIKMLMKVPDKGGPLTEQTKKKMIAGIKFGNKAITDVKVREVSKDYRLED